MDTNFAIKNIAPGDFSKQIEAKRSRLWEELTERQRARVVESCELTRLDDEHIAPFSAMENARERVLYTAYMAGFPRSVVELRYLLIARWFKNLDITTIRARVAQMSIAGLLKQVGDDSFKVMPLGIQLLHDITEDWLDGQRDMLRRKHAKDQVIGKQRSRLQKNQIKRSYNRKLDGKWQKNR